MGESRRGRLEWVEVGRGAAAIAVVCSHMPPVASFSWNRAYGLGAMGVEFFFLLSGFIMLHVHSNDLGRPAALGRFAWRRVGRIFPTYWIVLALVLAGDVMLVSPAHRATVDGEFVLRQFLLLPGQSLFVGPAWTLRHELLFYSIFAAIIVHRRAGWAVFGLWMTAVLLFLPVTGPTMAPTHSAAEVMLHHYNLDFALGMLLAAALRQSVLGRLTVAAVLIAALFCGMWIASGLTTGLWLQIFTYKAIFFVFLAAAVHASQTRIAAPKLLLLFGAASYSIYLANRAVGYNLSRVVRRVGMGDALGTWQLFAIFVAIAISAGLAIYVVFEKPILRWVARPRPFQTRPAG